MWQILCDVLDYERPEEFELYLESVKQLMQDFKWSNDLIRLQNKLGDHFRYRYKRFLEYNYNNGSMGR